MSRRAVTSGRPVILAVNPSHSAEAETRFWERVAVAADARGWQLVQLAARSIPNVRLAVTERMPARLWHYANRMQHEPAWQLEQLPEWLTESDVERHVDWEHRRWTLDLFDPAVVDGVHRLAWFAESVVSWLEPAVILTTNKIDHPCAFFRAAGIHHGHSVAMVERSPFDGIWIEPDGLFAESEIWRRIGGVDLRAHTGKGQPVVDSVIANPAGFRGSEASAERPALRRSTGPTVFLPMDNLLWTGWGQHGHPQGLIDNPMLATPQEALDAVADWAAARDGTVIVKAHPSCVETRRLGLPANVRIVNGELSHLIESADLTVAFNTKVAFVAAALGARLAVLADNPVAAIPTVAFWRRHETLDAVLDAALADPPPDPAETAGLYGWLETEYFYSIDEGPRGPTRLVADVLDGLNATGTTVSPEEADELTHRNAGALGSEAVVADGAPRVIIDVTRLVDPRGVHSGIGRYCHELVQYLRNCADRQVWGLVREPAFGFTNAAGELYIRLRRDLNGRLLVIRSGSDEAVVEQRLGPLRDIDLFHSTHLGLPDRRLLGEAQRVLTVHDVLHLKYPKLYEGPKPPTIQRVLDSLDPDDDWVITVSEQTRRDLLSLRPIDAGRVTSIHLGSAIGTSGPLPNGVEPGFVLAVVQAEPRKNLDATIGGIARALDAEGNVTRQVVLVVGSSTMGDADSAVREAGLSTDRVRYVHSPSDAELARLYEDAAVFVFGSIYEGFGLPPLEALSGGTPTVAVMVSSMIEVLGDAVVYATSGSPEAIAQALSAVLGSASLRSALTQRARERAKQLGWERSTSSHVDFYRQATIAGRR